ncbi:DUF2948 family protein [Paracoccus seriniphilus]|uniref:DUF2948 family protein n=1 Tax=Paracoccus seriniphilus TaxID=184748 RepID=A0A239PWR1_9RHOB|nr:DUF2948 family protein [Paracoccus seriniphilus]WCR13127.1 DUF2948 family protein [Paracoccus seriniphilus]SNT74610.1 Protein of unknown function [Paracoccus seriniphilus]
MVKDASFADGDERPLLLKAEDEQDLRVVSALVQDAILPASEISFDPKTRRLALLINRFRWEDVDRARAEGRGFERVRSLLVINDVTALKSDGIDRDGDTVLELLALGWQAGEDCTGRITLDFAGDGALMADVECINLDIRDVTKPYLAPSGKVPNHPA